MTAADLAWGTVRKLIFSYDSQIVISHTSGGPFLPSRWGATVYHPDLPSSTNLFPEWFETTEESGPDEDGGITPATHSVAYWLLVLIYLIVWSSVLGLAVWERKARSNDVPRGTP